MVRKPGSEVTLTPEAKAKAQIEEAFRRAGLAVPSAKEVLSQLTIEARNAEKILQILLREKVLVRVSPELVFHEEALRRLGRLLHNYKKTKGERIGGTFFQGADRCDEEVRDSAARVSGSATRDTAGRRRACYPVGRQIA